MRNYHKNRFLIFFVFLLLCTFQIRAWGQDNIQFGEITAPETRNGWRLSFTPYAWFAAQSSDVGTTNLRQSFNDLASITNVGFQGRMLVQWRNFYMATDWTYARMSSSTSILRTDIDMDLKQNILDLKLGKVVYDSTSTKQDGGIKVLTGVGARYWVNRIDLTMTTRPILPGEPEREETSATGQSWWDPALELGLQFPVTPRVGFMVLATGGGFGIGKASDYMWDAAFTAYFRPFRRITIPVGYRLFKYDRKDGAGDDEVRQTVTVTGPFIGIRIDLF